ncbi:BnaA05g31370D [Brassica napus]|uniref:BnaA05g31370D protein n=1 Tax=Brassica napus TaxID=3708 RepID=A0A078GSZ4_BRANA|nr:BnaA05g31370D [Brassica napus]
MYAEISPFLISSNPNSSTSPLLFLLFVPFHYKPRKSSKKSGKKHEPKPDTGGVSDEAEAPSDVAVGGASSHVNIGEEVVDPPPTSVNAAANSDVSVDTLQPGNTTATSDSGDEPRKEVANSENDISVALSTEEENVKSIDIGAAGAVDSLTSDLADTEKGVTHDDAEESLLAVRSELQKRSNELEQSEQRLLSTREKLSIAVVTC